MNKDSLYKILVSAMLGVTLLLSFQTCKVQKDALRETENLKKSIIASDKLIKEANGQYAKLVDYYKSERDLFRDLREHNRDLYERLKGQDEKLLSITNAIISLDQKVVQGFGKADPIDTNKINLSLKYPSEKDPFVFWDGFVNKNTLAYQGTFSFSKLPIKVILTEEKRGLWKSRIVGPDWLRVDSMSIMSIPPEEYQIVEPKKLQWLVGGSYYSGMNSTPNAIGVNLGLNILDRHNIILGANTAQQISLGYLYKIKTFKRNK